MSTAHLYGPRIRGAELSAAVTPKSPSLRVNAAWTLWGNITSAACQWGMVMVLAKMGSAELVGQYALALAITAPIVIFANLQLRSIQATDIGGEYQFGDYMAVRLWTTGAAALAMIAVVLWGGYQLSTTLAVLGVGLWKCVDGISDVFYGFLQRHERMECIAKSMLARWPLSLAALAAGVRATGSVGWGAAGGVLCSAAVLVLYDLPTSRRLAASLGAAPPAVRFSFRPTWRPSFLKSLVWSATPLGIVVMLVSLQANVPRYFLMHQFGEAEVGIFSALAYVVLAGELVTNALGQSFTPRLAKLYHDGARHEFRVLLTKLLAAAVAGGCFAILAGSVAGPYILRILYRPEYVRNLDVFRILLISAGPTFIASFLGYGLTAARLFWVQLPLSAMSTVTVAGACIWLVPARGLRGAAEAVLAMSIVRAATFGVVMAGAWRRREAERGRK